MLSLAHKSDGILSEFAEREALLSDGGKRVLWCVLNHVGEGESLSNSQIARLVDLTRMQVYNIRHSKEYREALRAGLLSEVEGGIEMALVSLRQQVLDGKYQATKLMLELSGMYVPTSRHESKSVNVNIDAGSGSQLPEDVKGDVVKKWYDYGWSKEEFCQLYDELA